MPRSYIEHVAEPEAAIKTLLQLRERYAKKILSLKKDLSRHSSASARYWCTKGLRIYTKHVETLDNKIETLEGKTSGEF